MSSEDDMDKLGASLVKAKSLIRQLKQDGAAAEDVKKAVDEMKVIQEKLTKMQKDLAGPEFDTDGFQDCLLRRMIVVPSFEIHGGTAGLYDLGPVGCSLKENILAEWKRHFIVAENMLQVEATCLTQESVLQASGHVERFADFMVKDKESGVCYRADKLLEDHIENLILKTPGMPKEEREELERVARQADAYSQEELDDLINKRFEIKAPDSGNDLSSPFPFNLMFKTSIGPEGHNVGYLRPETAQGLFVNFKRLLEFNYQKMPFAAAQIGLGFRNEINPRNGLIRVREFCMAEIEYFVDPADKSHSKFANVKDHVLTLFPASNQLESGKLVEMTAGEAVANGTINNETLAYFMVRTHLFFEKIGVDMKRLRFRQHLATEKAHYSSDCWDAEIKLSMGWVECVGHADRACYDLKAHSDATKVDLRASRRVDPPKDVDYADIKADKKVMGKALKGDSRLVLQHLESIDVEDAVNIGDCLAKGQTVEVDVNGKSIRLTPDMMTITKATKKVHEERFYPSVIEPSFGIGRILHAVLEHSYYSRDDDGENVSKAEKGKVSRTAFRFKPNVSPYKVAVLPLRREPEIEAIVADLTMEFTERGLPSSSDLSNTAIGRKYARVDEIGIPFAVTADVESTTDKMVTLRERDSQEQIRVLIADVVNVVQDLCTGRTLWPTLVEKHGLFTANQEE